MSDPTLSEISEGMQRILSRVEYAENGCWLWSGVTYDGYGKIRLNGRQIGVHRVSYMANVGPIPEGLQIDHLCRIRNCVNPDHLDVVTGRENVHRGDTPAARNASKTHCAQGHLFDEENTYRAGPHGRWRVCRTCQREAQSRYERRQREKV